MRFIFFVVGLFLFSASTIGDEIQEITNLYRTWIVAVEQGDIESYVSVLHEDVKLMPPASPPFEGKEKYKKFLKPVFASADYEIDVKVEPSVDILGDVAIAEYEYVIYLKLKEGQEAINQPGAIQASRSHNAYFDVLIKNSQGKWSVFRHTWRDKGYDMAASDSG